jgi:hypothetical protein
MRLLEHRVGFAREKSPSRSRKPGGAHLLRNSDFCLLKDGYIAPAFP